MTFYAENKSSLAWLFLSEYSDDGRNPENQHQVLEGAKEQHN